MAVKLVYALIYELNIYFYIYLYILHVYKMYTYCVLSVVSGI